ncbi:nickel/cobalt transporter [Streptomyces sp. NPDC059568]|uniref:nickel/cobalt transporter n=1 Tax=Streptomyces sp. NPDC059568 TaxID=3346868 RepID=UPI0036AC304B
MTNLGGLDSRLVALFDGRAVFWIALVVALGVGAAHAVAPGHGKAITAAYLAGTRGRHRDAVRLGVIVAGMHTFSVLVLALIWVGVSGMASFGTETATAWMQALAGVIVVIVGAGLVYRHLRGRGGHGHHHGHGHTHEHGHSHSHAHATGKAHQEHHHHGDRTEELTEERTEELTDPWSRRGLAALALSGGLLPSPSAFLVLVSGLLTGRALGAVALVIVFGIGMAVTLTGVGVMTIRGFAFLEKRLRGRTAAARLAAWTPVVAGVTVATGGCLYLLAAVSALST